MPQSRPSEDLEDSQFPMSAADSEDSDLPAEEEEVKEGEEIEASDPTTSKPKGQRKRRIVCPPKRLTYDILGENSEEVILTSQRTLQDPPNANLVEDNPRSPPGTSMLAIPV